MDSIDVSKEYSKRLFFASDLHLGHDKLARLRGFSDGADMNEWITETWNKEVPDDGLVILLGDISFMKTNDTIDALERLKGNKILVRGNHDKSLKGAVKSLFQSTHDILTVKVENGDEHGQRIVCCHFPMLVWDRAHYGSWHLHGHCHGSAKYPDKNMKILDVGIEVAQVTGSSVLEYETVSLYMAARQGAYFDHHTPQLVEGRKPQIGDPYESLGEVQRKVREELQPMLDLFKKPA